MVDATTRLRAEKQEYDSNDDAWGTHLNAGVFDVFDQAIAGVASIAVNANVTLDVQNFISDEARNAALIFTGAGGFTVTAPAVQKLYLIDNRCAADVTLKPQGGAGSIIRAGTRAAWFTDGVTGWVADNTLDKVKTAAANVSLGGNRVTDLADGVDPQDAVTVGQIAPFAQSASEDAEAAAIAAAASIAIYDDFDDRYLGTKSADPLTDNDGDPLLVGALYFNDTGAGMRVYDGEDWQSAQTFLIDGSVTLEKLAPSIYGTGANDLLQIDPSGKIPAVDGSLITNLPTIGVGQTWQTVTRSLGTSYQNITGKPIVAAVFGYKAGTSNASSLRVEVSSDNANWQVVASAMANYGVSNSPPGASAIIPSGHYYRYSNTNLAPDSVEYREMR